MADLFAEAQPTLAATPGAQRSSTLKWLVGGIALVLGVGGYTVSEYNSLQEADLWADGEWSQTLNQYTRRADLIPNLVNVVKTYAAHESALFSDIAKARSAITALALSNEKSKDAQALEQFQQAQRQLSASMSRLLMVAEKYPDLKASDLFRDLMVQLEGTENRIAYHRLRYINAVTHYNYSVRRFPTNLIAAQFGYRARPNFQPTDDAIKQPPKMDLK